MGASPCCSKRVKIEDPEQPPPPPPPPPGWAPLPEGYSYFTKFGCCGGLPEDPTKTNFIYTLQQRLANDYYLTGGCGCLDYFLFICNWHPLLGIFLSHPNHPFSKRERLTMMLISISISEVPAAWIVKNASTVGEHFQLAGIPEEAYPYIFITPLDILLSLLFYQLAVHEIRQCCCCDKACHAFFECMKNFLLVVCLICSVAGTVLAYFLLKEDDPDIEWIDMLKTLGYAYAVSWSIWFIWKTLLPCKLGFISQWSAGPPADETLLPAE